MSTEIGNPNKEKSTTKSLIKRIAKVLGLILLAILVIVILLGMIPASIKGLESDADPAESYDEALRRFEVLQAGEQAKVTEVNSSRLMTHGEQTDKVYVLIHGWTNSPRQFVELGELLFERGHNVLILRLPHHGFPSGSVGELRNVTPENLSAYGDQTVDVAAGLGEQVEIIGLSVGGAVTSWIAQNRPDVTRVMLISPLFGLDHLPAFVDYFLMNLFSRAPNINLIDPEEPYREHVYRGQSTSGVAQAMRFGESIFKQANSSSPAVTNILVVTNANDSTVDNSHTDELVDIWETSGAAILRYVFPAVLGLPHDSIDVSEPGTDTDLVYAQILELLGENPIQ
jgi:esterase/lipase